MNKRIIIMLLSRGKELKYFDKSLSNTFSLYCEMRTITLQKFQPRLELWLKAFKFPINIFIPHKYIISTCG